MTNFKKGTLIIGDSDKGKTWLVNSFTDGLKCLKIDGRQKKVSDNHFAFSGANKDTEIIFIDDYLFGKGGFEPLYTLIQYGVTVNKRYYGPFLIHPKIIVTCDCNMSDIKEISLLNHFFNAFELKGCLK